MDIKYFNSSADVCELRFMGNSESQEIGFFEGYVVTWGSIDSYNSTFKRGCFLKSLAQRKGNIKLLWNHENGINQPLSVIGTIPELREDDIGLFVRGQLALDVEKGREAYALMKTKAINTLSFGFRVIDSETNKNGVTVFNEVDILEVSPVGFEANKTARINQVRAEGDVMPPEGDGAVEGNPDAPPVDEQAVEEPVNENNSKALLLTGSPESLIDGLATTLSKLWWEYGTAGISAKELTSEIVSALNTFTKDYLTAGKESIALFESDKTVGNLPILEGVPERLLSFLIETNQTPQDLAMKSQLSADEITALCNDESIEYPGRIQAVDAQLWELYQQSRNKKLDDLIAQIKQLAESESDLAKVGQLLGLPDAGSSPQGDPTASGDLAQQVLAEVRKFNKSLRSFV